MAPSPSQPLRPPPPREGTGCDATLRYDGLYVSELLGQDEEHLYHEYLRFYPDGTVLQMHIASAPGSIVRTVEYFDSLPPHIMSRGRYGLRREAVFFSVTSDAAGTFEYTGNIVGDRLELHARSRINEYASTQEYCFLQAPWGQPEGRDVQFVLLPEDERLSRQQGQPVSIDPDIAAAAAEHKRQAWACRDNDDLSGALIHFDKAIAIDANDADAYYGRGVILCMLRNYEQAIANLDWAIEIRPHHPQAFSERGLAYVESGDLEWGMEDYEQAIALDPAYATAHACKGSAFALQGLWSEALAPLDLALKLNPRIVEACHNRAIAHENLGNLPQAIQDYEASVRLQPHGPQAEHVTARVQSLKARIGEQAEPSWSVLNETWSEFVTLSPDTTVDELTQRVQEDQAHYAIINFSQEHQVVASVYGRHGLRGRFTEIADIIGSEILGLKLGQFLDQWRPCIPLGPTVTQEMATEIAGRSGGCTVVVEADQVLGVFAKAHEYSYPQLPTVLFGPAYVFQREGRSVGPEGARTCRDCGSSFAYYQPVLQAGMLSDYACPQCGASPIPAWVEVRMKPGNWSREGFLGADERLEEVIAQDGETLRQMGITSDQIAEALDHLLDTASTAYEEQIEAAVTRLCDLMEQNQKRGHEGLAELPLPHSFDKIEAGLKQGRLPAEDAGVCVDDFQVFFRVYLGYQFCPWTSLRRPWSSDLPGTPVKLVPRDKVTHVLTVNGLALPCRPDSIYRYADRDFLLIHRRTGDWVKGPGLIVHLIRDHHFFEGTRSPYRVDPHQVAQTLGLGERP